MTKGKIPPQFLKAKKKTGSAPAGKTKAKAVSHKATVSAGFAAKARRTAAKSLTRIKGG